MQLANQGAPSSPKGLCTSGWPSRGPGAKVIPKLANTITTPETRPSGRHRLEGSLPSGKSRIKVDAEQPDGRYPVAWASASIARLCSRQRVLGTPTADEHPEETEASRSSLRGSWEACEAIRAPTMGKTSEGNVEQEDAESVTECGEPRCENGSRTYSTSWLANMATERPATRPGQPCGGAGAHPPTPRPCSLAPSVTTPLYSTTVSQALRQTLRGEVPRRIFARTSYPRGHGGPGNSGGGDTSHLTSFSIDGEYTSSTL